MNKELIIKKHDKDVDIALLEDNVLVELHKDRTDVGFMAGDIYLGRVKKNMPGLNACFLDIGHEKNAFMIYVDLGTQFRSLMKFTSKLQAGSLTGKDGVEMVENFKLEQEVSKTGKIANEVSANQLIPVQIVKEAISTKGPRVSSDIAIAGRYLVLIPFTNKISISQKIKQAEERIRLKTIVKSIKPDNFGIIILTMAESRMVVDLYI
ncbi:MAG: ribonuclease E/G, partial [Bacteroidales bacterium]|nr:ribonuclease E/G [Bacteroidales bacterium]